MGSKMSFTTPRSPRIAARLRVRTPACILLRATVQKKIEPNARSSVLWDWSIYSKNSNLFSTCSVLLFIIYMGVAHSYPLIFH